MDRLEVMPVNATHISDWTVSDPGLQPVLRRVQQGWGDKCPDKLSLEPFYVRRDELSTQWLYLVGKSCGDTSSGSETALRGPAHRPPRNRQSEKPDAELPMVARAGYRH